MEEIQTYNKGEKQYLHLIDKILSQGEYRSSRTGINTFSLFGEKLEFDISDSIPFLTTKRLSWRTMIKELLWFISGKTDNNILQQQGVHIWDGNSTTEFLDSRGLHHYRQGDLGPIYPHQWRHFGADYTDCDTDYTGQGVDQLQQVIDLIKTDPTSRRIILSAWNPSDLPKMSLAPCHVISQWYVRQGEYLDCQLYQRSADIGLGVPFNIASYSVLTYMLAHITGYKAGKFIHILGDAHIYENHISALKEQLLRTPYDFPRLSFARSINNINDFTLQDFVIHNYLSHPSIKMEMAV